MAQVTTLGIDLAQDFVQLVRQRQPAQLDPWLQRATASTLEALNRFATGLYEDYAAVNAGVTLPWSTGPVGGPINRLKMLKRQMFGRARLDLLGPRSGCGRITICAAWVVLVMTPGVPQVYRGM